MRFSLASSSVNRPTKIEMRKYPAVTVKAGKERQKYMLPPSGHRFFVGLLVWELLKEAFHGSRYFRNLRQVWVGGIPEHTRFA